MNEEKKQISDQTVSEAKPDDTKIKKVAIYSLIPTNGEQPAANVEEEIKNLTDKIQQEENWELYKIYTDKGMQRTSRGCYREELKKMLQDAKEQKIDLILCANFARLSRNIEDSIEVIKHLESDNPKHPVGIYFEKEHYYSLDSDSKIRNENMLSYLHSWKNDRRVMPKLYKEQIDNE